MDIIKKLRLFFISTVLFILAGCIYFVSLPYDLELVSNSSYLQIIDHDGWGVLCESAPIRDEGIEVSKLLRYLVAPNGLYVEITTSNDKILYVVIIPKDEKNLGFHYNIMNSEGFEQWSNTNIENLIWKKFR